jgi:hypothetical protein
MSDALFLILAKLLMHHCLLFVMGRYASCLLSEVLCSARASKQVTTQMLCSTEQARLLARPIHY